MQYPMSYNELKRLDDAALIVIGQYYRAAIQAIEEEQAARKDQVRRVNNLRAHMQSALNAGQVALTLIRSGAPADDACEAAALQFGIEPAAAREGLRLARRRQP